MFGKTFALLLAGVVLASNAHAATEYFRFTGKIGSWDAMTEGYDASFGFTAGQAVYFDFMVDTGTNAAGYPDSAYQNNFATTYIGGSIAGQAITHGQTASYPEGWGSYLFINGQLNVGTHWAALQNPSDESIDTWQVGDDIFILKNSASATQGYIAPMKLAYRGTALPPAYVPVPAAGWLFGSGIAGIVVAARRRSTPGHRLAPTNHR